MAADYCEPVSIDLAVCLLSAGGIKSRRDLAALLDIQPERLPPQQAIRLPVSLRNLAGRGRDVTGGLWCKRCRCFLSAVPCLTCCLRRRRPSFAYLPGRYFRGERLRHALYTDDREPGRTCLPVRLLPQ